MSRGCQLAAGCTTNPMQRPRVTLLSLITAAVCVTACGGQTLVGPSPAAPPPAITESVPAVGALPVVPPGRVAIISIDGLRPDALLAAGAPNIMAMANRGAYTWQAKTVLPSTTLPSHISMLTGYLPNVHGVTWDDYTPLRGPLAVPTLFAIARANGLRTAMAVGKEKFAMFRDTGACDAWVLAASGDNDVAQQATALASIRPDLLFVHLADVDRTGHASGWMSEPYLRSVRSADAIVGRIIASFSSDTTVIITADHGGHGLGHGSDDPTDTTIPWVIVGPAVASGRQLSSAVKTVDTAATAALILGVQLSPDASGRPVREAFAPDR